MKKLFFQLLIVFFLRDVKAESYFLHSVHIDCYSNATLQESHTLKGHEKFFVHDLRGQLIAEVKPNGTNVDFLFLHHNSVSTPLIGVNLDGLPQNLTLSDPYGKHLLSEIVNQNEITHDFGGKRFDRETKGHNFNRRSYNNTLGLFLHIDPQFNQFLQQTPYSFADHDPINHQDPTGESALYSPPGLINKNNQPQTSFDPLGFFKHIRKFLKRKPSKPTAKPKPPSKSQPAQKPHKAESPSPKKTPVKHYHVGERFHHQSESGVIILGEVTKIEKQAIDFTIDMSRGVSAEKFTHNDIMLDATFDFINTVNPPHNIRFIRVRYDLDFRNFDPDNAIIFFRNTEGVPDRAIMWLEGQGSRWKRIKTFHHNDRISYDWELESFLRPPQ